MFEYKIRAIAHIENDMPDKFGIPRQSGLVDEVLSYIYFEPEYRNMDALRGLEDFSHLWLLWAFENESSEESSWSPTVRPPKLGGNVRVGVFATRSPNRPNHIALSCVRLVDISDSTQGPILTVAGADLKHGTHIYDIKPYLPYVDSHPDAQGGFAAKTAHDTIDVHFPTELLNILPEDKRKAAVSLLAQDPRPSYHNDPNRVYGMNYCGFNIRFNVNESGLHVISVLVMENDT